MTREFGDKNFGNRFSVDGKKITYTEDITIDIAKFSSVVRAFEVYDESINAYNAHKSFTLPSE